jgi:hypothetical protein
MDTEVQDAILERMNYLFSLDILPFHEATNTKSLAANSYWFAMSALNADISIVKSLKITTATFENNPVKLAVKTFDEMFPAPANETANEPTNYKIDVAESKIVFNCPMAGTRTISVDFYKVPINIKSSASFASMTELAKLAVGKWAASDGFRMNSEWDRADKLEDEGNKLLAAIKRRYQLAKEEESRIVSAKEWHLRRTRG